MGEVYLARQRGQGGFEKLLVIKTLLPHLCEDEEFIAMFKDEARICAQLIHPNICQVFEFEQVSGVYYMAMEYLRGEDLRRLWKACEQRGTPLRAPLTCRIISDAAAGLDFAHALRDGNGAPYRIVHRDVSPQNLLVTFEGGVKLIDFGVAKAAGRAQHTRTGALKGKYSYMSPEQVAGAELDGRSDIFALGIVLHELLTGRRLFKAGSDVQTLARVSECKVPPPSDLNPQLPRGLDAIVLKALARDPRQRYATAQEFRLALEEWLIAGRMSASSAHLAEFLKALYAERLEKEARLGPLLGDAGLAGPVPGSLSASQPTRERAGGSAPATVRSAPATENQRTPEAIPPAPDPSTFSTESGAPSFRRGKTMWLGAGAIAAIAVVAAIVVLLTGPGPAAPGPQAATVKTASRVHAVTVRTDPEDSEIYEGARLIGRSPKVWADAAEGEHDLTLRHDGYREEKARLVVGRDGEEFSFLLRRIEPAKRSAPELHIKAER